MRIKTNAFFAILVLFWPVCVLADGSRPYEMPGTHVQPITNSQNNRQYELYIKLPDKYLEKTDVKYPVIYTTDAKWHFDMLSGATEYLMPDTILVGVSWEKTTDTKDEHASRYRDYTIVKFSNPKHQEKYQAGQAGSHLSFIRDNVIPYVEKNYRTDPARRSYFGYSLGGQFGAFILLAHPDTFRNYILGSPALSQRSLKKLIKLVEAKTDILKQETKTNVFLSIGELEDSKMEITKQFASFLGRENEAGLVLTGIEVIEKSDHGTAFPETVIRGVKWLSQGRSE